MHRYKPPFGLEIFDDRFRRARPPRGKLPDLSSDNLSGPHSSIQRKYLPARFC